MHQRASGCVCVLMGSAENMLMKTSERMRLKNSVWHLSDYLKHSDFRSLLSPGFFMCIYNSPNLRIRDKYIKSLAHNEEPSASLGLQAEAHLHFSFCLIGKWRVFNNAVFSCGSPSKAYVFFA